jgi:predicted nucleotidyltransferase
MKLNVSELPRSVQEDIQRAVRILKEEGCSEVFLFGSAATGEFNEMSDLDIAIRGCPKGRFFDILAKLFMSLSRPVDLVKLDSEDLFAQYLQKQGELLRVG